MSGGDAGKLHSALQMHLAGVSIAQHFHVLSCPKGMRKRWRRMD